MISALWLAATAAFGQAPGSVPLAQHLASARKLYQEVDLEGASAEIARAQKLAVTPAEQAQVSMYQGIVLIAQHRGDEARAAFKTALLLDPTAPLPMEVSPKVAAEVEALRAEVQAHAPPPPPSPEPAPPIVRTVESVRTVEVTDWRGRAWIPGGAAGALALGAGATLGWAWVDDGKLRGQAPLRCPTCTAHQESTLNTVWVALASGAGVAAAVAGVLYWAGGPGSVRAWLAPSPGGNGLAFGVALP